MSKTVLGGGIAGLTAAYYLRQKFPLDQIHLFEESNRTGGWIKSTIHKNGALFEEGPRTLRPRGYKGANTLNLVDALGLNSEVLPLTSRDAAVKNRMIYAKGKLHTLPSSFISIFKKQDPFSKPLIYYLLQEFTVPKKVMPENDESIFNFVERRLGTDIANYLISPLMCGICAGNASQISVKFLMEELFNYEQRHGSITKGLLHNIFKHQGAISSSPLHKRADKEKWSIYTFQNGLETLPRRLEQVNRSNKIETLLNSKCTAIEFGSDVSIYTTKGIIKSDHLISCVPAVKLATVIKGHPKLVKLLQNIPYVTVGVVNLQYNQDILPEKGFGFLVPPKECLPILGVTFDSCCYPCGSGTVLTVMMGGYWFNHYFGDNPSKEQLLDVATTQVCKTMGVTQAPDSYSINIHSNCIPQYTVGHTALIGQINDYVKGSKLPLSLCGSYSNGVGINDVIWGSKTAVDGLV